MANWCECCHQDKIHIKKLGRCSGLVLGMFKRKKGRTNSTYKKCVCKEFKNIVQYTGMKRRKKK
jgi:hypothetical protein